MYPAHNFGKTEQSRLFTLTQGHYQFPIPAGIAGTKYFKFRVLNQHKIYSSKVKKQFLKSSLIGYAGFAGEFVSWLY